jgi:predicted RNA-binding protein with PUA-like domain
MNRWLLKTEPTTYSFADLVRDGETTWDGVRNAVALKHLKAMAKGDECLIYHTGDEKRIVGLAKVSRSAYPDPRSDDGRNVVVDLVPVRAVLHPLALSEIKADGQFADWELVRQPRLSVMPVTPARWSVLVSKLE